MKTAIALLAVCCLGFAFSNGQASAQDAKTDAPKTLRLQVFSDLDVSLDPLGATLIGNASRMQGLVYQGLYHWVPGKNPTLEPLLAEDFPTISEDGLTWTIKLRKGVKFHKNKIFGKERTRDLKAQDVIATLKRIAADKEASSYWLIDGVIAGLTRLENASTAKILKPDSCSGLKAIDDHTLQITLTRPFASLLTIFAHPAFAVLPIEALRLGEIDLKVRTVGTGPFRLAAISEDKVYAFTKNTSYWGKASYHDRVIFGAIEMGDNRINGVASTILDERHYLSIENNQRFNGVTLDLIRSIGSVVRAHKFGGMPYIAFNMADPIWGAQDDDGRALRKAVCMTLKRDSFDKCGLNVFAQNSKPDGMYPVGMEHGDLAREHKYNDIDAVKAAKLLEGTKYAGGKNPDTGKPLKLVIASNGSPEYALACLNAHESLKAIGITVEHDAYRRGRDSTGVFEREDNKANAVHTMWFLDSPDAQNFLQLFASRNVGLEDDKTNFCNYKSDTFDKALDALQMLPMIPKNSAARRGLIKIMTAELAKDRPYFPLADLIDLRTRNVTLAWPQLPPGARNDLRFLKEKE